MAPICCLRPGLRHYGTPHGHTDVGTATTDVRYGRKADIEIQALSCLLLTESGHRSEDPQIDRLAPLFWRDRADTRLAS